MEMERLKKILHKDVLITLKMFRQRETGMPHVKPLKETYCYGTDHRLRVKNAIIWRRLMLEQLHWLPDLQSHLHVTERGHCDPVLAWADRKYLRIMPYK